MPKLSNDPLKDLKEKWLEYYCGWFEIQFEIYSFGSNQTLTHRLSITQNN